MEVRKIQITERQQKIIDIVKADQPITSEQIASKLGLTRATLRPDLSILTMSGLLDARPKVGYFYTENAIKSYSIREISNKKVANVMSIPIIIEENVSIHSAIVTMFLEDVGSIFITSNKYLTGVVSRKDLLKSAIGNGDISSIPVSMAMTRMPNIICVKENETVEDALRKLIEHEVDSLPVVQIEKEGNNEQYVVVGRFSKTTVARLFMEILQN